MQQMGWAARYPKRIQGVNSPARLSPGFNAHQIQISRGGQRWVDHGFIERLWHSLKYEEVYEAPRQAEGVYFRFYNEKRRHQGLARKTPEKSMTLTF
ncbi:integrase core domain-containing protein [Candidatus Methylomicrobium oryzae]|uniref:integrase core domain-containing protein n=1 Tax=Candidatus Methylomicrobium oryzae TaxID=2802053 RepID=UPI001923382B|nr:integrase core domain-containing protein [Methylomicrobium sp. RS1]MBL1265292.1 transposase [Methylomicrobium sp. RS1]